MRPLRAALALATVVGMAACREAPRQAPSAAEAVLRPLGTWHGRGSQTVGVVSDSGRLRVSWSTSNAARGGGYFRLSLHSAVSGRPLQVIVDQRGETKGATDISDDPRPYNFMVDSADVDWSFSVEEIIGVVR